MKLSIVLPAYNEEGSIEETLRTLYAKLQEEQIDHEIVVVNDNSKDNTLGLLTTIQQTIPSLVVHTNHGPNGFGYAIRYGLERFQGDCVAIMMSDLSDDPADLVAGRGAGRAAVAAARRGVSRRTSRTRRPAACRSRR